MKIPLIERTLIHDPVNDIGCPFKFVPVDLYAESGDHIRVEVPETVWNGSDKGSINTFLLRKWEEFWLEKEKKEMEAPFDVKGAL